MFHAIYSYLTFITLMDTEIFAAYAGSCLFHSHLIFMIVLQMTDFKLPDALHLGIGSTVEKMSRLKRKKKNNHPPFDETSANCEEANKTPNTLMNVTSTPRIFERAIASAGKHKITLKPEKENGGHGN